MRAWVGDVLISPRRGGSRVGGRGWGANDLGAGRAGWITHGNGVVGQIEFRSGDPCTVDAGIRLPPGRSGIHCPITWDGAGKRTSLRVVVVVVDRDQGGVAGAV